MFFRTLLLFGGAVALGGCTTVDIRPDVGPLKDALGDRAGASIILHDGAMSPEHSARVAQLAGAPLTMAAAVELALTGSPELQARYAEIGIASAEMAAATALVNPVIEVMARPTTNPAALANLEFGLTQNLLNLLTRKARRAVATAAFEAQTLVIAADVVAIANDVRRGYIELIAAKHKLRARREADEAAAAAAELATALHTAGNISDLEFEKEKAKSDDTAIAVLKAEADVGNLEPEFAALIGMGDRVLIYPDVLPSALPTEPVIDGLEKVALTRRLDLAARRLGADRARADLKARADWRLWEELNIGLSAERDGDGGWALGPSLEISLPLMARGNPEVAEAIAGVVKAENEFRATEGKVLADVRSSVARLAAARKVAERYAATVLPSKRSIVDLTQREYNFMLVGAFDLLDAKRDEADAVGDYVEALHDYWLARVALAEAIGGADIQMPMNAEDKS